MNKIKVNELEFWQFHNFKKESAIKHFVTSRHTTSAQEFTLSYSSSPNKEQVRDNRALLATSLGVSPKHLFFPTQVHKTKIVRVTLETRQEELQGTDALITHEKGLCIAVMSADCVPVLLYDKEHQAIGAVHAGWRGTVAKIVEKTLQVMQSNFGTKGEHIIAGIGPSVCQESYEVGEEVIQEVNKAFTQANKLLIPQSNNKAKLDLWMANKLQLLEFGVPDQNIEIANLCTVKNNDSFFSARKGDTGRFAAGILLQ